MITEREINLININEAAKFLNLKISRLRAAVFRKEIPYVKLGALIRFDKEDLLKWLESKKIESNRQQRFALY